MYPIARYLLVAQPHEALCNAIMQVKEKFAADYDCADAVKGKPNITLLRFEQYEMLETKIIRRLGSITAAQNQFVAELHDFGSFPSHSIFLNITTKSSFIELVKSLRPVQSLMKMDKEHKPHFITDPYISIARKLLPWQYEKGWLELSNTSFSGRFVVDQVILLRKRENDLFYTTVQKCRLLNVRQETVQGDLFK